MTKRSLILALAGALLLGLALGRFAAPGADATPSGEASETASPSAAASTWTCSMHPQIERGEPSQCPICGMDLVPRENSTEASDANAPVLRMSARARALAEVETSEVGRGFPETTVRLVGRLDYDETRVKSLTARFPARIEKLFVNYTGIQVKRGEHLAEVYSPELLTAQRELLGAHASNPDGAMARAARQKLRLWDLTPEQIDAILERGTPDNQFTLQAPAGGTVVAKNVNEGDYVETGDPFFRIADLSELWLILHAYESDLAWLRYGQDVSFSVDAFPGETFHGRIAFIAPRIDPRTRTVRIRVNVPNEQGRLKAGMFARGRVRARFSDQGEVISPELAGKWISPMHPEIVKDEPGQCPICGMDLVRAKELGYVAGARQDPPLTIPASAVLRTGERAVVYVERDAEAPRPGAAPKLYEGREIVLGPRAGDVFVVKQGLREGERVVTQGAFKIDSAMQIQAKPSMMSEADPPASPPAEGSSKGGKTASGETPDALSAELAQELLPPYLDLHDALASDDLDAARKAARAMLEAHGHRGPFHQTLHAMAEAESLAAIREPHFRRLSAALLETARTRPRTFDRTLHRMHCPMANDEAGANWLQATRDPRNPYFGESMLQCGSREATFAPSGEPKPGDA